MHHKKNDDILIYDTMTTREHSNGVITGKTEVALQLLVEDDRYRRISAAAHKPSTQSSGIVGILHKNKKKNDPLVPVLLQTASNYAILSKSGDVTNRGLSSLIGNLGTSSIKSGALTGFGLVQKDITSTFAISDLVTGRVYAANYAVPTPAMLTIAVSDMLAAYLDAAIRSDPDSLNLSDGTLNGETFVPGLYRWESIVTVNNNITFDGGPNDIWIMQVIGPLSVATNSSMKLLSGAIAKNIFWQIAGEIDLATHSHFEGIVLGAKSGKFQFGSSINGCVLLQSNIALDDVTINCENEKEKYSTQQSKKSGSTQFPMPSSKSSVSMIPSITSHQNKNNVPTITVKRSIQSLPSILSNPTFINIPSLLSTQKPSFKPINKLSSVPSDGPSDDPSLLPSDDPSVMTSTEPSVLPLSSPSLLPSDDPSVMQSVEPSVLPSSDPSEEPSLLPSDDPSVIPTDTPSVVVSEDPSSLPSVEPSNFPSPFPSDDPSVLPSDYPSLLRSDQPSIITSGAPSWIPSDDPSVGPSIPPTIEPSLPFSFMPSSSSFPSAFPANRPNLSPFTSNSPSLSRRPSLALTTSPSLEPSAYPSIFRSAFEGESCRFDIECVLGNCIDYACQSRVSLRHKSYVFSMFYLF